MRLNGTFATVELSALKGRYWDGQADPVWPAPQGTKLWNISDFSWR